ncbi:TPA: hypothetical protein I7177_02375 [Vibrio vulnificus]|nr:hypothetical protein [Vibrio vulnificus]
MNSISVSETTSINLIEKLSSFYEYKSIAPTRALKGRMFRRPGWYESTEFSAWEMKDSEVLFDDECYWIEKITLASELKNTDVKIMVYPYGGFPQVIQPNSRAIKEELEELNFVISRVIHKIELSFGGDIIPIEFIKIEGLNVNEINRLLRDGRTLIKNINDNLENIEEALSSKVEALSLSLEVLSDEQDNFKNKISSYIVEEEQAKVRLSSIQVQVNRQEEYLDSLSRSMQKGTADFENLRTRLLESQEELDEVELNKETQANELSSLNKEVNRTTALLNEYKKKSELFSEDFSTLKVSVFQQNLFYGFALILTSLFGWWIICNIYEGALSLSLIIDEKSLSLKSIWPLFISRLPIMLVNFILLTALSSITMYLVKIIVKNNEETKTVKQAAYLIREVSTYQKVGIEMTESELFEHRVNAKMKLIQKLLRPESEVLEKKEDKIENKSVKVEELIKSLEDIIKKCGSK